MTDYSQNQNYTAKDALSSGDPEKVILGSDIDSEFSEIETAIGTKADKPTGSPVADLFATYNSGGNLEISSYGDSNITSILSDVNDLKVGSTKNVIINGDFRVWQRGFNFTIDEDGAYTADRWFVNAGTPSGDGTVNREAFVLGSDDVDNEPKYYLRYTHDGGDISTGNPFIYHRIEDYLTFAGEQITVSFWIRTSVDLNFNVTIYQSANGSTSGSPTSFLTTNAGSFTSTASPNAFTKKEFTVTLPEVTSIQGYETDNNHLELRISMDATGSPTIEDGDVIDLALVQLERGVSASEFEIVSAATTYSLCERFYQTSYLEDIAPGASGQQNTGHPHFYANSSNVVAGSLNFKTRMRATPSVTIYRPSTGAEGTVETIGEVGLGASPDQSYVTSIEVGENGIGLFNSPSLFTTGVLYQFHYTADAEL